MAVGRGPTRSRSAAIAAFWAASWSLFKRLRGRFVQAPQHDLWDRQRVFNLILLEYLQRGEDVRKQVTEVHEHRINHLEAV